LFVKEKEKYGHLKINVVFHQIVKYVKVQNLLMIISSDVLIAMVQIKFMIMMMEKDFLETVNCVTKMDI
jgi:hypothetical protein